MSDCRFGVSPVNYPDPDDVNIHATFARLHNVLENWQEMKSKKISNDQELIQSDPISCPQNQKGNN